MVPIICIGASSLNAPIEDERRRRVGGALSLSDLS